jgi:subtilisin family serine protease
MAMIGATTDGSYRGEQGSRQVRVGVIDTGIDASHSDIAPNFDRRLSRNFTTDIPLVDGPCAEDPDGSCEDPADVDEGGHGTLIAGTIGAALNGLGVAGVAPKVKLVNLRDGQDSGCFFVQESVDALTFAAYTATCEGPPENNGFYGDGIVDAERVASIGGDSDSD